MPCAADMLPLRVLKTLASSSIKLKLISVLKLLVKLRVATRQRKPAAIDEEIADVRARVQKVVVRDDEVGYLAGFD